MRYSVEVISTKLGADLEVHTIKMNSGFSCKFLNIGASILEIQVPDKAGQLENVVLAYPNLGTYYANPEYVGCTVGPTSGRIWQSALADGLSQNKGLHHIHGGFKGLSTTAFEGVFTENEAENCMSLTFKADLPDGLDGYPGNRQFAVVYKVYENYRLTVEYHAVADKATWVNMTNHSYFNLSGAALRAIEGHELTIDAKAFLETDAESIPTGKLIDVEGTAFDFRTPKPIGSQIDETHPQLIIGRGYDHPFLLQSSNEGPQVVLRDPESGRTLSVRTNQPAAVIYTNNYGIPPYGTRTGVCIECQKPPIGWERCFEVDSRLGVQEDYFKVIEFWFGVE